MNYYNEFDPKAAAWLRELIKAGLIPAGHVDERSITEVQPNDLNGHTQCHFFAGIGGWSLALQLAGWPSDRPVWTGSCPCQPFSCAGKQLGTADERHLWPAFFNLIRQCRPEFVFGEQVEGAVGKGWLDGVCGDLESEDYACGSVVLGAHSVGSPHIRQRLYWVANSTSRVADGGEQRLQSLGGRDRRSAPVSERADGRRMDNPQQQGLEGHARDGACGNGRAREAGSTTSAGCDCGLAQSHVCRCGQECAQSGGSTEGVRAQGYERSEHCGGSRFWSRYELIPCADGKSRRIEPGLAPLAHGVSARVVRLRGYGNAIVPQVAARFIQAALIH